MEISLKKNDVILYNYKDNLNIGRIDSIVSLNVGGYEDYVLTLITPSNNEKREYLYSKIGVIQVLKEEIKTKKTNKYFLLIKAI
jgi:hypothetical protein